MVEIGQKAPDLSLILETGERITLGQFLGKKVVLYFYPKDDTSGCTKEACAFRDSFPDFSNLNAVILGVSKDSIASHQKFKTKYDLPFSLISDETGSLCEAFGVWVEKSMYGKKYMGIERSTFLINEQGIITHMWKKVKVDGHSEAVLKTLK